MSKKNRKEWIAEGDIAVYYSGGGPFQRTCVVIKPAEARGWWYIWDATLDGFDGVIGGIKDEAGRALIPVPETHLRAQVDYSYVKNPRLRRIWRSIKRMFRGGY